jgi:hypothetical protein
MCSHAGRNSQAKHALPEQNTLALCVARASLERVHAEVNANTESQVEIYLHSGSLEGDVEAKGDDGAYASGDLDCGTDVHLKEKCRQGDRRTNEEIERLDSLAGGLAGRWLDLAREAVPVHRSRHHHRPRSLVSHRNLEMEQEFQVLQKRNGLLDLLKRGSEYVLDFVNGLG